VRVMASVVSAAVRIQEHTAATAYGFCDGRHAFAGRFYGQVDSKNHRESMLTHQSRHAFAATLYEMNFVR
jgi:hypothetical protein